MPATSNYLKGLWYTLETVQRWTLRILADRGGWVTSAEVKHLLRLSSIPSASLHRLESLGLIENREDDDGSHWKVTASGAACAATEAPSLAELRADRQFRRSK